MKHRKLYKVMELGGGWTSDSGLPFVMWMRKRLRLFAPCLWSMVVATICSCGVAQNQDDDDEREQNAQDANPQRPAPVTGTPNGPTNESSATLLFDLQSHMTSADLGLTIQRFRGWHSNPPNYAPAGDKIDQVTLELWFTVTGDETPRYIRLEEANGAPLSADTNGWVFQTSRPIGAEVRETYDATSPPEEIAAFTVEAQNALLNENFPPRIPTGAPETVFDGETNPWKTLWRRKGLPLTNFIDYRVNEQAAELGQVGCLLLTPGSASTYTTGAVAIGHLGYLPKVVNGSTSSTNTIDTTDKSINNGDSVIEWTYDWHIAGVNVSDLKLRIFRTQKAPLYNSRQLSGDYDEQSTEFPGISRLESLVRTCNSSTSGSGSFRPLYVDSSGDLNSAQLTFHCAELATLTTNSPEQVPLTDYLSSCSWSNSVGVLEHGSWNGSEHSEADRSLVSATATPYEFRMSDIIEFNFLQGTATITTQELPR